MSSFNHYGITPAAASNEVLNKILRDEWGFRGMVLTDYFGAGGYGYMNADRYIRNGNDFCLTAIDTGYNYVKDKSATAVIALRKASHNILYTTVNSRAYAPENLNLKRNSKLSNSSEFLFIYTILFIILQHMRLTHLQSIRQVLWYLKACFLCQQDILQTPPRYHGYRDNLLTVAALASCDALQAPSPSISPIPIKENAIFLFIFLLSVILLFISSSFLLY